MRLALLQMAVGEQKQENLHHAWNMVKDAAQQGAQLAVLPEMFLCPYENESFVRSAEEAGGTTFGLSAAASQKKAGSTFTTPALCLTRGAGRRHATVKCICLILMWKADSHFGNLTRFLPEMM